MTPRCPICGRKENCCERCHAVHDRLRDEPLWVRRGDEPVRIRDWDLVSS